MEIINLPLDIIPASSKNDEIIIHEYAATKGTFKGKSILSKNAISLVLKGQKTMHFAEKTVQVDESTFHFLSVGNCLASVNLLKQDEFRSILIFYDDSVWANFLIKHRNLVNSLKKQYSALPEPYISIKKDDFIWNYISSLRLIMGKGFSMPMKLLKFEELMLYLLEKHPQQILSLQTGRAINFDDVGFKLVIETNITNNLTLGELAFLCNTSLSTFKRRFLALYACSPNKWILKRRMEIAAGLLGNPKERPSDVYHKVGYENHSSFSQSFRQAFGVTPKEYQQQHLAV